METVESCLIPDFNRIALNFFPFSIILSIGLSYIAIIMLAYIPSILNLFGVFNYVCMFNLVKGLWVPIKMIAWFLSLESILILFIDYICQTMSEFLEWSQIDHDGQSSCVLEFDLLRFYWEFYICLLSPSVCVSTWVYVEAGEQLSALGSLFSPCVSWGSNLSSTLATSTLSSTCQWQSVSFNYEWKPLKLRVITE